MLSRAKSECSPSSRESNEPHVWGWDSCCKGHFSISITVNILYWQLDRSRSPVNAMIGKREVFFQCTFDNSKHCVELLDKSPSILSRVLTAYTSTSARRLCYLRGLINCAFALRFHFALFTLRFCQQVRSALLRFFFFKPQTSYKVHLYKYGSEAHFCAFSVLNHKQATKYIYTSMGPKRTFALFLF